MLEIRSKKQKSRLGPLSPNWRRKFRLSRSTRRFACWISPRVETRATLTMSGGRPAKQNTDSPVESQRPTAPPNPRQGLPPHKKCNQHRPKDISMVSSNRKRELGATAFQQGSAPAGMRGQRATGANT